MKIDVYKKYDFKYNEKVFMENLKNELIQKGYNTLGEFHELLCTCGVNSYDTARSYYNLRRVIQIDLLKKLCERLDLNVTEIMFPNGIDPTLSYKDIKKIINDMEIIFNSFNDIFYIYNDEYLLKDGIELSPLRLTDPVAYYEDLRISIQRLTLILAKYNYCLQQFYYADLCDDSLKFVGNFSINHLYDIATKKQLDWKEFRNWKKELVTDDFLKEFYNKYTFMHHDIECSELLKMLKRSLPLELFNDINNLMPENIRVKE